MINKTHDVTPQAVVEFARNGLKILAEKYGGDCTLNEARVMIQIIRCHLDGRTCSVTALHKATGIPIPTVSRAVANLQNDGWLSDQRDPADGRSGMHCPQISVEKSHKLETSGHAGISPRFSQN